MEIKDYFYTAQEATNILGINRITIWRWIKGGRLETQKIGGVVLIPKWQVELIREGRGKDGNLQRIQIG